MHMSFYSIVPFFACMLIVVALSATPLFAAADAPSNSLSRRIVTLDGLRGFLALAVFFHHSSIYHRFLLGGPWALPPSRPYALMGQMGVAFFFMITGYLFWSRLLDEPGRTNWVRLYIGRVFRIGPLYLAAIAAMLVFVAVRTRLHLHVPAGELIHQVGRWLELGFVVGPDVNGYGNTTLILAGVTWTLHYEWVFYLALPYLALFARYKWLHLPVAAAILIVIFSGDPSGFNYSTLFLAGMISASLLRAGMILRLPNHVASMLVLALIGAAFASCDTAYAALPILLMGPAFYLIASGCTLFGLLTCRPARRLGEISYGIYLLQGLVLAVVLRPAPLRAIAVASPLGHWSLVCLASILLVVVATVAHHCIERPGIALGKRVADLIEATTRPTRVGEVFSKKALLFVNKK
jgi:peptidoglycan/LPS O-acetylase OafA/YrhL